MTVLSIKGLDAGYAGSAVVRDLNLHVQGGEIVALLGPNGAGKTTTLMTIAGVLAPFAGAIEVFGEPVRVGAPHRLARRGFGYVTDDRGLFFGLTTRQNLDLGCRRGGPEWRTALEAFPPLEPLLDRKAGHLSGGEQQMLALARALLGRPRLLLIDEMTFGLAPVIVQELLPLLRRAVVEHGTAVLLVEQHVHIALAVADRGYVLSHGRLEVEGTAAELQQRSEIVESSYMGEVA